MRRALSAIFGSAVALGAGAAQAQQKVPVIELTPPSAKSTETVGTILGLRQLPGGKVLVDDGARRQIRLFDSTLTHSTIVIDSTQGVSNSYGPVASPIIPWLGDSTLWVDRASSSFVVFDPKGQVARTMAPPRPQDLFALGGGAANIDDKGRLLYAGPITVSRLAKGPGDAALPGSPMMGGPIAMPDSAPILRADFDTRGVDTVGRIKRQSGGRTSMTQDDKGGMKVKTTINPLTTVDEWAVLTDGSIAFVRGHDYHVDFIHPDGSTSSSAKLPFDWKRLTDEDKQHLIDSARKDIDDKAASAKALAADGKKSDAANAEIGAAKAAMAGGMVMEVRIGRGGDGGGGGGGGSPIMNGGDGGGRGMTMFNATPEIEFVPLKEIADYYPAIRQGAAKADLDGNLWILPTTSAQSKNGELVYDIVNNKGELFQRVRLPAGRSIAGFRKGGVVYLMSGDRTNGFYLERARLIGGVKATTQ
jgi:hypothetical protein